MIVAKLDLKFACEHLIHRHEFWKSVFLVCLDTWVLLLLKPLRRLNCFAALGTENQWMDHLQNIIYFVLYYKNNINMGCLAFGSSSKTMM